MGNSNSSSGQVAPANWSQSLEPPDQRNRMKKSYFPPRHYAGGRLPPQKVLPAVNPAKAAKRLKATSNGAILHGGGTISGRKLLNELDLALQQDGSGKGNGVVVRKKSNSSTSNNGDTGISGVSTPNLSSMEHYDEAEEDRKSRDYDSDPESRSMSPVPVTLISESPAKKQITKKKYQAPAPPPAELNLNGHYFRVHDPSPEPESKKKLQNRIFKTKAESKTKQALALELERKIWEKKQRKDEILNRYQEPPRGSTKDEPWRRKNKSPTPQKYRNLSSSPVPLPKSSSGGSQNVLAMKPESKSHGVGRSASPLRKSSAGMGDAGPGPTKSFYFGMDMGESQRNSASMTKPSKEKSMSQHDEDEVRVTLLKTQLADKARRENFAKSESSTSSSRSPLEVKMEIMGQRSASSSHQPRPQLTIAAMTQDNNNSTPNEPKNSARSALPASNREKSQRTSPSQVPTSSNKQCESDSDGLHCRQDSGSFELVSHHRDERASSKRLVVKPAEPTSQATIPESWSSDLSSSEMDIPLLLRPTLPLKRTELPRFSPSAAWRALDSPRPSEQSLSSEEGFHYEDHRIQRHKRPVAPPQRLHGHHERSGDSGISAGDGGSPANPLPEISPPPMISKGSKAGPSKCWTPEQDLDESSSDFDQEDRDRIPPHHSNLPVATRESVVPSSIGPRTPPKLTTRSHLFSQAGRGDDEDRRQPLYARSSKARPLPAFSLSQDRGSRKGMGGFRGLDTNWFLSRSEPNSLNAPELMLAHQAPEDFCSFPTTAGGRRSLTPEDEVSGLAWDLDLATEEIRSEIGYGPSSMNLVEQKDAEEKQGWSQPNSLILSHIMYLPAYDSRRLHHHNPTSYFHTQRRTRSVDNPDPARDSPLFRPIQSPPSPPPQHPNSGQVLGRKETNQEQSNKRKKFKFQSTLRVLERKRIEKQLAREAEEKERERLREMENMREVEEEFQRKRAREKLDREQAQEPPPSRALGLSNKTLVNVGQWDGSRQVQSNNNPVITIKTLNESGSTTTSIISSSVNGHAGGAGPRYRNNNKSKVTTRVNLTERQEPEGAPASISSNPSIDLRKELIHASRKRNGVGISGGSSDLTQELSEFRQNTRQYCDYRRTPRTNSASPARFAESSSSDIYPVSCRTGLDKSKHPNSRYRSTTTTTTVHPEVICDIPSKPFPYTVNFSRLSGSTSNLVMEERPGSGMGYGNTSGPSSIVSDNYRRDWAHNRSSAGSIILGGGIGGRASSIASLHSPSDHFRHSGSELNVNTDSPKIASKSRKSPVSHKYSSSPASSPLPAISSNSSNGSSIVGLEKGSKLQSTAPVVGVFQPQPFNSGKSKGYRPVVFKPTTTTSAAVYRQPNLTSSTSVI